MVAIVVAVLGGVFVAVALVSGWIRRTPITGPMLALAAGLVLGPLTGVLPTDLESSGVLLLAELTLAVILFVDATRVDLRLARRNGQVPARMLLLGLPLVVALGTWTGVVVLGVPASAAFVLACVLAPTDAALGQALLDDERVPLRVRQALNVESGLNDGLVVPFLTVALVVADATGETAEGAGGLALHAVQLIGVGALVGAAVGSGMALALRAVDWHTLAPAARQVGVTALVAVAWGTATALGGNGFVASFVAGVCFGALLTDAHELVEFGEDVGQLLALLTFIVFGAVFVGPALGALGPAVVLYVVLQLTLVRMLPIGASLLGTGLRRSTVGLLGWFGPRGLATVVFGLEVLELAEEGSYPPGEELFGVAALAVVASVLAHGLSAAPLATAYSDELSRSEAAMAPDEVETMPEEVEVADLPIRRDQWS